MVNSVSSNNLLNTGKTIASTNPNDVKNLTKYVNNQALKEVPDTFSSTMKSAGSSVLLFEGLPLVKFIKNKLKLKNATINNGMKAIADSNKNALNNLFKGEGKFSSKVLDFIKTANTNKAEFTEIKAYAKAENKAAKAASKAVKKAGTKAADKTAVKAAKAAENAAKSAEAIGKKTAESAVKSAGKFGKIGKFMKSSGCGIMLAFSGIIEGVTEVIPTFKELGAEKGMKQLGKSAVKVVGDTVGFIAGEQLGVAAGTAIGTAICPGIGTAVGAVFGFVGGMLGSFIAGKATKAITGKSEREKAQEQQAQETANQVFNDKQALDELKNMAAIKIQEEMELNNGNLSEDSMAALEILERMENEQKNPFAA